MARWISIAMVMFLVSCSGLYEDIDQKDVSTIYFIMIDRGGEIESHYSYHPPGFKNDGGRLMMFFVNIDGDLIRSVDEKFVVRVFVQFKVELNKESREHS
jgi:hypothetical protein